MLGEQVGEETGQITAMRVLPSDGTAVKVEVSFQASGTLLDADVTDTGTYVSVVRPDGTLFGEGQGVLMTSDGGVVTWRGQGVGRFLGRGSAVAWRGALYYQTTSSALARLNGTAAVFEYDTDESGKTEAKLFEWK
jgi:hypothetical protein